MTLKYNEYESAFGAIRFVAKDSSLCKICVTEEDWQSFRQNKLLQYDSQCCLDLKEQLDEYFSGGRISFDLSYSLEGTDFQRKVWHALLSVPYGKTASYLDIAVAMNNPKAVRAVGQANRANPLPIVIPCHRVIGKNSSLTGYAGTRTDIKEFLLQLEGAAFDVQASLF